MRKELTKLEKVLLGCIETSGLDKFIEAMENTIDSSEALLKGEQKGNKELINSTKRLKFDLSSIKEVRSTK